jgi:lysophospholipase L1-like esterase
MNARQIQSRPTPSNWDFDLAPAPLYSAETMLFLGRVLADGGTVKEADYVNTVFGLIAAHDLSLTCWASPRFAVKTVAGALVSKVYCLFGNDLSQTDESKMPLLIASPYGRPALFFDGENDFLEAAAGVFDASFNQDFASYAIASKRSIDYRVLLSASSFTLGRYNKFNASGGSVGLDFPPLGYEIINASAQSFSYDGAAAVLNIDGLPRRNQSASGDLGFTGAALKLGAGAGTFFDGLISDVVLGHFQGAVSDALIVQTIATARTVNPAATLKNLIVFIGDSLTFGAGASAKPGTDFPSLVGAGLADWDLLNAGSNETDVLSTMAARVSEAQSCLAAAPLIGAARAKKIAVLWGGVNDMGSSGTAAEIFFADFQALGLELQALGFSVIALTTISYYQCLIHDPVNARRLAYNELIKADGATFAAVCDIAANPLLGAQTATPNGDYFQSDQQNLTDAGYALVAAALEATLSPFI